MREFNSIEIIHKLRGGTSIEPVGETYADQRILESQRETQEIADRLISEICWVAQVDGSEFSKETAREEAIKWLKEVKDYVNEVIEESENNEKEN